MPLTTTPSNTQLPTSPLTHSADLLPRLNFPENLPISLRRIEIAQAIAQAQVVIVCGETGSGKTTQLPKICLSLGRGIGAGGKGLIGHTQPRRLAATATARRIAQELDSPLGKDVGFKIRFQDKLSRSTSIKLMTDGILLAETQSDPLLSAYDTLIIDEAHERSLNIDFLLGYLKQLLPKRPDLKVIVTSATIDADRFAKHFGSATQPAPIIEVSGRLYPVEVRYRPILQDGLASALSDTTTKTKEIGNPSSPANTRNNTTEGKARERDLYAAIVDAIDELCRESSKQLGDILVFLPGEREIREAAQILRGHHPAHTEILPLFARLSAQEQEKIFRSGAARRIVLATNVAETSLTVPGIRYVVDTGLARVKRYAYRNKVEQLHIEPIAQSSANQRAGRCGRVANGICIRLYAEQDFLTRPRFADPEIFRSSLAAVILRMKSLGLGEITAFPFLDAPSNKAIHDGMQLLQELGAINDTQQLTPIGNQLATLPLDPRVGRMLLAARDQHCLREMLIIASALSVQDPRERPIDQQEAADQAHQKFADEKSEFLSFLKIWAWFNDAVDHKKTNRQLYEHCRSHFLSQMRLREWRDVHTQLVNVIEQQQWKQNESLPTYEQLHLALLTGLLGNIGCKAEGEAHYLGARGIKFFLWPGSRLHKKIGQWLMASELVETSRLFARTLARIEPAWLEKVGAHLIRTSVSDPHWEKKAAQVCAYERGTLYGLTVYQRRRVDFAKIDPTEARNLLIRRGLVEAELDMPLAFFRHNQKLVREIEALEHTARRQDVLVDDELIFAFYDQHIPAHITSGTLLAQWIKEQNKQTPRLLFLSRDDLMRHEAAGITTDLFPKKWIESGIDMALSYHFEPGSTRDGVTLTVPLYALNQINEARCDWLVPGMLKEKIHLLLKSLPQKLRRHCVPLPDYAAGFCTRATPGNDPLIDALIADLRTHIHLSAQRSDFKLETLPIHHTMNFKIVDEEGRQLDMGRNLATLRAALGKSAQHSFRETLHKQWQQSQNERQANTSQAHSQNHSISTSDLITPAQAAPIRPSTVGNPSHTHSITDWQFGVLPELLEIHRDTETLFGYPALVDQLTHCTIEVFDTPQQAQKAHHMGLLRLFSLQLRQQIKFLEKNIPHWQEITMHYLPLGSQEQLREQLVQMALTHACLGAPLPHDANTFAQRVEQGRSRLNLLAQELARHALSILSEYTSVAKKLQQVKNWPAAHTDMHAQLLALVGPYFLRDTPAHQLNHLPRYLKGMQLRIDKLRADPARDTVCLTELTPLYREWQRATARRPAGPDTRLEEFRWMLEELRITLFAQTLRTPMPVSVKRLQKIWQSLQN